MLKDCFALVKFQQKTYAKYWLNFEVTKLIMTPNADFYKMTQTNMKFYKYITATKNVLLEDYNKKANVIKAWLHYSSLNLYNHDIWAYITMIYVRKNVSKIQTRKNVKNTEGKNLPNYSSTLSEVRSTTPSPGVARLGSTGMTSSEGYGTIGSTRASTNPKCLSPSKGGSLRYKWGVCSNNISKESETQARMCRTMI